MNLGAGTDAALTRYLSTETWFRANLEDWNRWYEVVDVYSREHGHDLVTQDLVAEIERRISARGEINDVVRAAIESRVAAAERILEFLEYTRGQHRAVRHQRRHDGEEV